MHRLFVGLRPPRAMRERLLDSMGGVPGARWQDDGQLHVTLRFIGEVDARTGDDIVSALAGVDGPAPDLAIDGVGMFDRKGQAHTLYARVTPAEPLRRLQRRVERALVMAGVAPEPRAFLPHVTLARMSRSAGDPHGFLVRHVGLAVPAARAEAIFLFESDLGRDGATYTVVERFPLT